MPEGEEVTTAEEPPPVVLCEGEEQTLEARGIDPPEEGGIIDADRR